MNSKPINQGEVQRSTDAMQIRKIFQLFRKHWHIILICIVIAGIAAYLYNRYTIPTYLVNSSILIEESNHNVVPETDRMLQGFGLQPGAQNIQNQILILTSWTLIQRTLEQLDFGVDFYRRGLRKELSYYPDHPVHVELDSSSSIPYNIEFSIRPVSDFKFRLTADKKSSLALDTVTTFWRKIELDGISFTLYPNRKVWEQLSEKDRFYFVIRPIDLLTESYRRRLNVRMATREGSILNLSLEGTNIQKERDFLNQLVDVFMASNLEKKNFEAMRIIEFIDRQLENVSDSLMIAENKLQEFRSRNRIMDISAQGQQIIQQAVNLEDQKARLILEKNYYDYLDRYLARDNTQEVPIVAPASMGIDDPLLASLMQELSDQQSEYFSGGVGDKNPLQTQLEMRIGNTKQSLRETLQGIIEANKMAMEDNAEQIRELNARASGLPRTERQLLGIEREFELNNVLYTFLLQKKAEAQIQKASNAPDNELIDPARASRIPVAPRTNMIYMLAVLLGLGLPVVVLMLAEVLDQRISSEEDLKSLTSLPVLGHIPHSRLNYQTVVLNDPQSIIAEAYRNLRIRIEFFTREISNPVILVTSSMPSEGKSFTALNLASAYSLAGKKTVLLGFDLRRPKLALDLDLDPVRGISSYIIGKHNMKDVIQKTRFSNLDVIPSGPIPPNPAELTASIKTQALFEYLRTQYEYIIVDSPPIGTVSDSYYLASLADTSIITVRHGQTIKRMLEQTIDDIQANGITELGLLVNDLKTRNGVYGYKYSYSYKYELKKAKKQGIMKQEETFSS